MRGAKGDQYFISRSSVEKYAEELRQISAIASISAETRHDASERDEARKSASDYEDTGHEETNAREPLTLESKRLTDENVNLRIDNRAKEQVINMLMAERVQTQTQLQDMSYRLGSAESRLAQLDTPKEAADEARPGAPESDTGRAAVTIPSAEPEKASPPVVERRRSLFGQLFGR